MAGSWASRAVVVLGDDGGVAAAAAGDGVVAAAGDGAAEAEAGAEVATVDAKDPLYQERLFVFSFKVVIFGKVAPASQVLKTFVSS